MEKEEIKKILENHQHWLNEDCDVWRSMCANLCGANLRSANLCSADLCGADLRNANLCGANLCGANLCGANLRSANLCGADLRNANLCGADLCGANLCGADLRSANLCGADLRNADLCGADLRDAENIPYIPMICPEEDSFVGWKKASDKIVKLEIPADAKRSSATSRKCRCNKARVIAIYEIDGTVSVVKEVASDRDSNFIYKVGQCVEVADFDEDRWNECSTGVHFFMNRQEAINYNN